MRYVVRPQGILTTPYELASRLGARVKVRTANVEWEPGLDFFMAYPSEDIPGTFHEPTLHDEFNKVKEFFTSNKREQRDAIQEGGIYTPMSYSNWSGVLRPLRHTGGAGFEIHSLTVPYDPSTHYLTPFFPKEYEYRMIYCRGELMATLLKRVPEGIPNNVPWNHSNGSSFLQVEWGRCRLRFTSVRRDLEAFHVIQHADLVAVEVMIKRPHIATTGWDYAVCEFNSCPGITIEAVLNRIVEKVND